VSFDYLKPNETKPVVRNVEPWLIQNISGQWLLLGLDLDRSEPRNFLLRRIVSEVDIQDHTFDPPEKSEVQAALEELEAHKQSSVAIVKTVPRSAAWFHYDLADNQELFEIQYMDLHLLAEELMEFIDHIEIVSPSELTMILTKNIEAVRLAHA
jgi:proteasome accessory factor B